MKMRICDCQNCFKFAQEKPELVAGLTGAFAPLCEALGITDRDETLCVSLESVAPIDPKRVLLFALGLMDEGISGAVSTEGYFVDHKDSRGEWRICLNLFREVGPQKMNLPFGKTIEFAPVSGKPRSTMSTFCHEMVHFAQTLKGELRVDGGNIVWQNVTFPRSFDKPAQTEEDVDFHDSLPWELDAETRGRALYDSIGRVYDWQRPLDATVN